MDKKEQHLKRVLDQYDYDFLEKAVGELSGLVPNEYILEYLACYLSPEYFISNYCYIFDTESNAWVLFELWEGQVRVLNTFIEYDKSVTLKARQMGISWLALCYILWDALFNPPASALILSKKEEDAKYLLSRERLRGVYERLPEWLQADNIERNDALTFGISRGKDISVIRAASTASGDGYTCTAVLIDEADLSQDLRKVLLSIEPTINAGGKLMLVSKADRSRPNTQFKRLYRESKAGKLKAWGNAFIAWWERPSRDQEWYETQKNDFLMAEGHLDSLYESYPATDEEALRPLDGNKRIPAKLVVPMFRNLPTIDKFIVHKDVELYEDRVEGTQYVIGVDCAEGLVTSDESPAIVLDAVDGRHVASLTGNHDPISQARIVYELSKYFYNAPVLVERNNHGASFINTAMELGIDLLNGTDKRAGFYLANKHVKIRLFDDIYEYFLNADGTINDQQTFDQIVAIEKDTLRAPEGEHDDRAIAYFYALWARQRVLWGYGDEKFDARLFNAREWD